MSADYQVHGTVAVITLNNPPVNGLGLETRTAAVQGMRRALADDGVKAIVITGAGKAFSGGADIREFNSPKALAEPSLDPVSQDVPTGEHGDCRAECRRDADHRGPDPAAEQRPAEESHPHRDR